MSSGRFAGRVLIALGIATGFFLVWKLADVLMLAFAGVLLATLLRTAANALSQHTRAPSTVALVTVVVAIAALLTGAAWLAGAPLTGQLNELWAQLPGALEKLRSWIGAFGGGALSLDAFNALDPKEAVTRATSVIAITFGALGNTVIVLFLAIYLALDPALYVRGVLDLVPKDKRARVRDALESSGHALRQWLWGQLVAMVVVGVLTGVGLWLLGVPFALSLGFIAGLLEFIPFVGPVLSAIPGIVLGFTLGPEKALYVALLYFGIQQIEGTLLMPLIQRWAVSLPPALGVIAVVVFGLLFGIMGVLFATPLMVVVLILVRKLYVEAAIGEPRADVPPPVAGN
jgi:predicted PurR-regulated permease PerM